MATLRDLEEKVNATVMDEAVVLSQADKDLLIREALARYSLDRPCILVAEVAGTNSYDLTLPADFIEGFSVIKGVEYPAGQREPSFLEPGDYMLVRRAAGTVLRLISATPAPGETVRIIYTGLQRVDAQTSSVPEADLEAVGNLAASLVCRAMAARFGQSVEPTLSADSVNYQSKSAQYSALADKLLDQYRQHVGQGPATVTGDMDLGYAWGADFLFHPRRWR